MPSQHIFDQEPFSFQSCQEDDYFLPLNQSFLNFDYYDNQSSIFMSKLQDSNEEVQSRTQIFDEIEAFSTQVDSTKIDEEKSTTESLVYHYRNMRRKKHERAQLKRIYKLGSRYSPAKSPTETPDETSEEQKTAKLTKNFLAFGKKPHMDFIELMCGKEFFESHPLLVDIDSRNGMTLKDYDNLYKCEELRPTLRKFFSKQLLYRSLMTSRTTSENKIFYLYYMKVFEKNFRKGSFRGISETMLEIERQNQYL